jgi:hypothetical protein
LRAGRRKGAEPVYTDGWYRWKPLRPPLPPLVDLINAGRGLPFCPPRESLLCSPRWIFLTVTGGAGPVVSIPLLLLGSRTKRVLRDSNLKRHDF